MTLDLGSMIAIAIFLIALAFCWHIAEIGGEEDSPLFSALVACVCVIACLCLFLGAFLCSC